MTDPKIEEYITTHISPEPERLNKLYRDTWLHHLYPRMCSGHLQGRILKMFTEMIQPLRILELGTYTGYSAYCLAEGMPVGAHLDTIEIDDEMSDELSAFFAENPRSEDITLHIGDAEEVIKSLPGYWDLIYIDANKRRYPSYFNIVKDRLIPGGYIIADNTLWSGQVVDPIKESDPQLQGILEFNRIVNEDPDFECIILPVRDGMSIIRKKK